METAAMSSGTSASHEAKTATSTMSAPVPPRMISSSRPMPSPPPESVASASTPVMRMSRSRAASRAASSACGFSSGARCPGGGRMIAAATDPSSETSASPVASREPGTASAIRSNGASASPEIATIGATTPPLRKRSTISRLASKAGRSGASSCCESASDRPLDAQPPTMASRIQAPATMWRRRMTRSVRRRTGFGTCPTRPGR
jgi:hypothetical protein